MFNVAMEQEVDKVNMETEDIYPPQKKQKCNDNRSTVELNMCKIEPDSDVLNPDDIEKLREFKVLDEVKSNEDDSNDEDSDSSDDKSEDLPDDEVEKMLDSNMPENFKADPKPKEKPYVTRAKIVLDDKCGNKFQVLPLDWMMLRHHSGMPIYVNKVTRVCTLSKPYFLGKGNIRRHDIPITAIPCLAYRRALEEESKQKEIDRKVQEQIKNLSKKAAIGANQSAENTRKFEFTDKLQINFTVNKDKSNPGKCPFSQFDNNSEQTREQGKTNETTDENNKFIIDKECNGDNTVLVELDFTNDSIIHNGKANDNSASPIAYDNTESAENINKGVVENQNNNHIGTSSDNSASANDNNVESTENDTKLVIENQPQNISGGNITENPKEGQSDVSGYDDIPLNRRPVILPSGEIMPAPRVESVNNSWKTQNLTPEQLNSYCSSLFQFKSVNILQFNRWADRRKYAKAKKTMQYPTLPEGTKVITIPVQNSGQENGGPKRDWVMNMNGGSYLSVFHEYVCRALQKQPVYEYKQLENATTPYQATVFIGGMQYGVGHGSSKRQAKYAAARASIHILIPEMREYLDAPASENSADPDFTFFDYVGIEDPRISEFCASTCEPSPHAILRTCLLRNFGASDRHIHTEMKKTACQEIELTMKVGKHNATVVCKNKKTAKQRASQAILQALHPHVRSWGSLLRLYGSKSVKSCKEKKLEEQQITLLQDKARHNEPNYAVLEKLRNEMKKLRERDESVVPIGTLLVTDDLPTHSGSNLNNVDL